LEARRINLRVGETYRLELGGLSSAGYAWEYIIDGPQGIAEVSTEMIGAIPQLPPGGPSPDSFERQKIFNINALESGTTQVRIFLRRSWERDKPPLRELCLKILVSK
jgi:predicted secreted protein